MNTIEMTPDVNLIGKPACPYIAGRPLSGANGFYGREDVFDFVINVLRIPHENVVVLSGQRRIGKTSILLQLEHRLPKANCLPVRLDLMDRAQKPLGAVLFDLAEAMARQVGLALTDPHLFDDAGNFFSTQFLPAFYLHLPPDLRPVLMFDEFDVLDGTTHEPNDEFAAAKRFYPYLRRLMDEQPRLSFVFVIGRSPQDLSADIGASWKAAHHKRVSVLDEENTRTLITQAERQGTLRFSSDAVTVIWELTGGHPLLTQLICQIVWTKTHPLQDSTAETPVVNIQTVTAAAEEIVTEHGQSIFQWIWRGLPSAEKIIFAIMAEATTNKTAVGREELLSLLQKNGIRLLTRELEEAPRLLVEWDLLRKTSAGHVFPVELLRRWILQNRPISSVKDEVANNDPIVKSLYESAEGFYRQRKMEGLDLALQQLRLVLNVNPNHVKTRLLIAQILQEQNKLAAALDELEQSYRYDAEETRYSLIRVLVLRAEEMERNGQDPRDILPLFQRALELSPYEQKVSEQMLALWLKLGERDEAAGDLDSALHAYQQACANERIAAVQKRQKQKQLEQHAEEAHALELRGQFSDAAEIYQHLLAADSSHPRWQEALQRCHQQQRLRHAYLEGVAAFRQNDWTQAQRSLAQVVSETPSYQDAAELLQLALAQTAQRPRDAKRGGLLRTLPSVHRMLLLAGGGLCLAVLGAYAWRGGSAWPSGASKPRSPTVQSAPGPAQSAPLTPPMHAQPSIQHATVSPPREPAAAPSGVGPKIGAPGSAAAAKPNAHKDATSPGRTPSDAATKETGLQASCGADDLNACIALGQQHELGTAGVSVDKTKAMRLYTQACEGKQGRGCYLLGRIYLADGSQQKARSQYGVGCAFNDPHSCFALGEMYEQGKANGKPDPRSAEQPYQQACAAKLPVACFQLANLYFNNPFRDMLKSSVYYEKSCHLKYSTGCYALAYMHENGQIDGRKDLDQAVSFYAKGCDLRDGDSCKERVRLEGE